MCPALNNLISDVPKWPPTRARLLTSQESLNLREEKEQKMEVDAMEKEKRENERVAKKKEREELMQKKEEERVKKAEEKARKAEEKAKTSRRRGTKRRFSEIEPKLPTLNHLC